jgi:hypothetical protein
MRHLPSRLPHYLERLSKASLHELAGLFPQFRNLENLLGRPQRYRCFPPWVVFWMFLHQALNPGCSCRRVLIKALGWMGRFSKTKVSARTAGYCQARCRLPLANLFKVLHGTAAWLENQVPENQLWHGRRVRVADGTIITLPDTRANQRQYPQQKSQRRGCGFPILRLVAVFSLASGALVEAATCSFRTAEVVLFRSLTAVLKAKDILLADRSFCSYFDIAWLGLQGVDAVIRFHARRSVNTWKVKQLGKQDWLVCWSRPERRLKTVNVRLWKKLPPVIRLRQITYPISVKGMRTKMVTIVTTLLDPIEFPAADFAELYLQRWRVELFLHQIKQILKMETLTCCTPEMVQKELCMHLIAYNLIRCLIWEAAGRHQVPPSRISFKAAVAFINEWATILAFSANHPSTHQRMRLSLLDYLAGCLVPLRSGRREPRAVKRRPKPFQLLTKPRKSFREVPHRGRIPYMSRKPRS